MAMISQSIIAAERKEEEGALDAEGVALCLYFRNDFFASRRTEDAKGIMSGGKTLRLQNKTLRLQNELRGCHD